MTDGYRAIISLTLIEAGDIDETRPNGMCFGVTPNEYGGYCFLYFGDSSTTDLIAQDSIYLQWFPFLEWTDSYWPGVDLGEFLDIDRSGIVFDPDVRESGAVGGMAVGAVIEATWY